MTRLSGHDLDYEGPPDLSGISPRRWLALNDPDMLKLMISTSVTRLRARKVESLHSVAQAARSRTPGRRERARRTFALPHYAVRLATALLVVMAHRSGKTRSPGLAWNWWEVYSWIMFAEDAGCRSTRTRRAARSAFTPKP